MQEKSTKRSTAGLLKTTALGTAISITLQLTSCYAMAFANTATDDKAANQIASTAGLELLGPGGTSPSEAFDTAPVKAEQPTLTTIHENLASQEKTSAASTVALAEPVSALREAPQETTSVVDPNAAKDGKNVVSRSDRSDHDDHHIYRYNYDNHFRTNFNSCSVPTFIWSRRY